MKRNYRLTSAEPPEPRTSNRTQTPHATAPGWIGTPRPVVLRVTTYTPPARCEVAECHAPARHEEAAFSRSNGSEPSSAVSFQQNTVACAHSANFRLHAVEVSGEHQVELSVLSTSLARIRTTGESCASSGSGTSVNDPFAVVLRQNCSNVVGALDDSRQQGLSQENVGESLPA